MNNKEVEKVKNIDINQILEDSNMDEKDAIEDIVLRKLTEIYIDEEREEFVLFLSRYMELNDIKDAVETAIKDTSCYKRHKNRSHAFNEKAMERLKKELLKDSCLNELSQSKTFDSIMEQIHMAQVEIKGIGELAIYDIALGIGAFRNQLPEKVYLHRGAREGAKCLEVLELAKRTTGERFELLTKYPKCLEILTPYEIENLLCIVKETLNELVVVIRGRNGRRYQVRLNK